MSEKGNQQENGGRVNQSVNQLFSRRQKGRRRNVKNERNQRWTSLLVFDVHSSHPVISYHTIPYHATPHHVISRHQWWWPVLFSSALFCSVLFCSALLLFQNPLTACGFHACEVFLLLYSCYLCYSCFSSYSCYLCYSCYLLLLLLSLLLSLMQPDLAWPGLIWSNIHTIQINQPTNTAIFQPSFVPSPYLLHFQILKILQTLVSCDVAVSGGAGLIGQALVPYYRQILPVFNIFINNNENLGESDLFIVSGEWYSVAWCRIVCYSIAWYSMA